MKTKKKAAKKVKKKQPKQTLRRASSPPSKKPKNTPRRQKRPEKPQAKAKKTPASSKNTQSLKILPKGKRQPLLIIGLILVAIGLLFLNLYLATGMKINPRLYDLHPVDKPLTINLGQKLKTVDVAKCQIEPEITGHFEYKTSFGLVGDSLRFVPDDEFRQGTLYTVKIDGIERILFGDESPQTVRFVTEGPPIVVNTNIKSDTVIPMDAKLFAELSSSVNGQRDLILKTDPETEWDVSFDGDKFYEFTPKGFLPSGTELKVIIYDLVTSTEMTAATLKTASSPTIESGIKSSDVTPDDELSIKFSESIVIGDDLISFDLSGSGLWLDDRTFVFKPDSLTAGQTYSYTLKKGMRTKAGGILTEDQSHEFSTRGPVAIIGKSPSGSNRSQARQSIKFTFSYPVDHTSAQNAFGISGTSVSKFSWEGNTLVATVENLGYQQTISAWVNAGVTPAGFGQKSTAKSTVSFTTEARTTMLSVPFYYQEYAQSCEESALRSGLAYRGAYADDWAILQRVGYNPRHRSGDDWDNPNYMFVGDVNGSQRAGTGYGAFWEPIAAAGRSYGVNTVSKNLNVGGIAGEIHAGNPVIVWTVMSGATWQTWHTPQGDISVPLPIHVKIIYGAKGESWAPQTFYVWDPISGKMTYTANNLSRIMFGNVVVVY